MKLLVSQLLFLLASGVFCCAQVPQSNHVWVITEENHSYESVIGNPAMPYYNQLAARHGLATQYYSNRHSSLSALMWLVSGQTVTTDNDTTACFSDDNLVYHLLFNGLTWKSYQIDLPYAGFEGLSWLNYVRRHNPLIDFADSCYPPQSLNSVPYSQLAVDMANNATPNFIYITPNLDEDAHDGTLAASDAWLAQNVPGILARPEFQPGGDGLLLLVWDEGDLTGDDRCSSRVATGCGGRVATLLIGPQVRHGFKSSVLYAHPNALRTICSSFRFASCPGAGATASAMTDFFNTVKITNPPSNSVVASPLQVAVSTNNDSLVFAIQIYVDGVLKYQAGASTLNVSVPIAPGPHHIVAQSWDTAGGIHKADTFVTAQSEAIVVTSPLPHAIVSSPMQIDAAVEGNNNVYAMQAYVDNVLQYTTSGNALHAQVPASAGPHRIVIQSWDKSGSISKQSLDVIMHWPAISINSPSDGASLYSPINFSMDTIDANRVYATQLYVDDVLAYEVSGTGIAAPVAIGPGSHRVTLQAWDTAGAVFNKSIQLNVLPVPVKIVSPAPGTTVGSPVLVQASVPASSPVYEMQVYVDNTLSYQTGGTMVNNALPISPGNHAIVVQAWDNGGGIWKRAVQVTVP